MQMNRRSESQVAAAGLPLSGVTIIELCSFVAGPYSGLTLSQLGADVIRVDPLGGAPDIDRWPISTAGRSMYWAGLNKGKRSICLDVRDPDGREVLRDLVCAANARNGAFITNVSAGWLSYEWLSEAAPDLIMCQISGRTDGAPAVDYTVNASLGFPMVTGAGDSGPVNSVLPAWDLLTGSHAAIAVLTAIMERSRTGAGRKIDISLEDVGIGATGALGIIAEASTGARAREKDGNYVYGTYGSDFETSDGKRVMVVALTPRQWRSLCELTGSVQVVSAIESALGCSFENEGDRYLHRGVITSLFQEWFSKHTMEAVAATLEQGAVLWSRYQTFDELVRSGELESGGLCELVEEPYIGGYRVPRSPIRFSGLNLAGSLRAPLLGENSCDVLEDLLDYSAEQSARLVKDGLVSTTRDF